MESLDLESQTSAEVSIVVIGDQRAGKTSVISSLCHGAFSEEYVSTVGVDYDSRILDVDGKYIKLHLWDTSGQESFLWVAKRHIKQADAFVLVYDVTNMESFAGVRRWMKLISRVATARDIPKLLLGTKLDLRHKQVVSCSQAKEFAIPEGFEHIEISSRTGKNVNAAFYILANKILSYRKLGCLNRIGVESPVISFPDIHVHEDPSGAPLQDGADYQHLFKILILGAERVGKTSLRYRFCKDLYNREYVGTTGFDYSTRTVGVDNEKIKLQIWDVSGDPIYDTMRKSYYRGANAYIIVYDVTNKSSFLSAEKLLKELSLYGQSECPKIVVGNKTDKGDKRAVDRTEAADWADGWRVPHLEASCRHGNNVDAGFLKVALALRRQLAPWKRVYDNQ